MRVVVVRTYVEMRSPAEARLDHPESPAITFSRARPADAAAYRETFQDIGREVLWVDRWEWKNEEFERLLGREDVAAWLIHLEGTPAGLIEGFLQEDGSIQYTYFGVRPRFQGKGLGKYLLSHAIERSWELGVPRIWLFTLTSDGEHALANYLKRGFKISKRRAAILEIPEPLAPAIRARMEAARARGLAPGFLRQVEARLRANPLGVAAQRIVWEIRQALKRSSRTAKG